MSVEASVMSAWSDWLIMLSTRGVIGPITEISTGGLAGEIADIRFDMLAATEFVVVLSALKVVVSVSCTKRDRSVFNTAVSIVAWDAIVVDIFVEALARTFIGVVLDIISKDANTTFSVVITSVLESVTLPILLEK